METASFFHVCTDGNCLPWLFKDEEDFIKGVNLIAFCTIDTHIKVVCYSLMDNHIHLILYGSLSECKKFINKYKTGAGKWIKSKYGIDEHLRHLPAQIIPINSEERLMETIAYIDRNPIVAGYRYLASEYKWGSSRYMFKNSSEVILSYKVRELSHTKLREILKTRVTIPSEWIICADGMIDPRSFLDIETAEKVFKSPIRYIYFLSKKLEGKLELTQGTSSFYPDKELRRITQNLAIELFADDNIKDLDFNSKIVIARKLRYNYASTPKQISRMLHLPSEILSKFI